MKTARLITVTLLSAVALTALTACSSDSDDGNDVPTSWISTEYSSSGVDYLDTSDPTTKVADEIHGNTSSQGRISDGDMVLLRYDDDIVAISPHQAGSRIEIDDYRSGYNRWSTQIGTQWPAPDSDEFRGGGPGEGK